MEAAEVPAEPTGESPASPSALRVGAAVLVFVGLGAVGFRMNDVWGRGIMLVLDAGGAAITFGWALQAAGAAVPGAAPKPKRDALPGGGTTALLVIGLSFVLAAIIDVADILGADGGAGATTWTTFLFALIAGYAGWMLYSPVCALLSSGALGVAFLALIQWVFDPDSLATHRWFLLLLVIAYAVVAFRLDGDLPRHSVQHVSAAGLALLALLTTFVVELVRPAIEAAFSGGDAPSVQSGTGWEAIGLIGALAVVAYAVARREPGPGFIGAITLSVAVVIAAAPADEASLVGWPLLLAVVAGLAVAAVVVLEGAVPGRARQP